MGSMDAEAKRRSMGASRSTRRRQRRGEHATTPDASGPAPPPWIGPSRGQMRLSAMSATEASGNGPDTAERAPLDARGWVPSVFRARPAKDKESGRAMPATPGKKDRLTCAWGLQPKGRRDATREGQDGGSRRRRDHLTTASDGTYPASVAENSMPEEARPRGSPKK